MTPDQTGSDPIGIVSHMPDGFENPFDDDPPPSVFLPPDDRLWRHPSEVGRLSPDPQGGATRRILASVTTGLGIGMLVIGAVLIVGWLDAAPPKEIDSAEQPIVTHVMLLATSTTTTTSADDDHAGYLGVYAANVDAGVQVTECLQGSPAADALRAGDVILAFDGHPTATLAQLETLLRTSRPGTLARIDIRRAGTGQTVWVTLATSR